MVMFWPPQPIADVINKKALLATTALSVVSIDKTTKVVSLSSCNDTSRQKPKYGNMISFVIKI
jgi:hypothetical protein